MKTLEAIEKRHSVRDYFENEQTAIAFPCYVKQV